MTPGTEQRLRSAGLRVTRPRVAVLDVLDGARQQQLHLLVSDIVERARRELGAVSTQAVYDCLEVLARAGLVRRVESAGSPARYETRTDDHHHLVCRGCGLMVDVDCAVGATPCLRPASTHGFSLGEAEVFFWGLCPTCTSTPDTHDAQLRGRA